jgi:hypothetical protein
VKPARVPFSSTAALGRVLAAEIGTVLDGEVTGRRRRPDHHAAGQLRPGVVHHIGPGVRWAASTVQMATPDPATTFWKLEDPVLGKLDSGNLISY